VARVQTNLSHSLQSVHGPLAIVSLKMGGGVGQQDTRHGYPIKPGSHRDIAGT
jgi:hypothetical protein